MDSPLFTSIVVIAIAFISLRMLPRLLAGVPFVDAQAVFKRMEDDENAVMIDVRTPEEFESGHALNSINVQPHEIGENIEEKRKYLDHKVYVMCLSSQRAAMAAKSMKNLGFTNVSVVKGGMKAWQKYKLPLG
ncbi:putative Rhodanese-like protein [Candidatus Terasakiella magnetica]|uniref:Putative Rhodanese-like protein n=1 Tax=Candidatus Terasakiella magnetica TaxID=1867952 RepID=A0A1C3RCF6_9PROT|nr:rhodanese-like domain-containing protein [Candidatus Terasakiella magnetica]SCA54951.1 putative Rhodanese-like protein [Candidatus Terasakiella magnetica]